jgi:2-polyprenyl-3-methyl-5-hydroxy-6-metoxy-1,4-benzoquinol methylase
MAMRAGTTAIPDKTGKVKLAFEEPTWYLQRRRYQIQLRAEVVKRFVADRPCTRILDIGCGDGSISIPLLRPENDLTLLDLSTTMLSIAGRNVPAQYQKNVHTLNEDFLAAQLAEGSFDLILCIGVLAHAESPADVVAKIAKLLSPGGCVIGECTDSRHFTGRLLRLFLRCWGLFRPRMYPLNALSADQVVQMFSSQHLALARSYRYALPPPGSNRFLSQAQLYRFLTLVFGAPGKNRNPWLGNEYIFLFKG